MDYKSKNAQALSALTLVQLLFGINFVSSKIVVSHFQPTTFASLRFLIGGLIILGFSRVKRSAAIVQHLDASVWKLLLGLGVIGIAVSQSLFLWGLRHSTSTNTAIISSSIPLFTILIVWIRRQASLSKREITGLLVAFSGLLIFYDVRNMSLDGGTLVGDLAILVSCFLMAAYISYCKDLFSKISTRVGTMLLFLIGGAVLLPFAILDFVQIESPAPTYFWEAFTYSVFAATLVTYFLNNWSYKYLSPSVISIFIYLQPIAAAVAAYEFFGETLTARKILSACLIFIGMLFSVRGNFRQSHHQREKNGNPNESPQA